MTPCRSMGFTLTEVLLSLALLSGVTLSIASWTTTTARTVTETGEPLAWQAAARTLLLQIERDLVAGDFAAAGDDEHDDAPRIVVDENAVRVTTRTRSGELRKFAWDPTSRVVIATSDDDEQQMLWDVETWEATWDEVARLLSLRVVSPWGQMRRSYHVP